MNGENTVQYLIDLGSVDDDICRRKCQLFAKDIQMEQKSVLEFVEELGPLLTHTSPYKRELGLTIFNNTLEALPKTSLCETQLDFITKFYTDRLKDHSQIIPVTLKGILTLANYKNLPKGSAITVLKSLFLNVHCQHQKQPDRYNIYCIFKTFLDSKLSELQSINYDFVLGVITAIDGERDPCNLLFLFNWLPQFLQNLNLGHLVEEVFELMACYFPVDFKAPATHPDRISREELADTLCQCLCALPEFGQFSIPLALEKLDTSLQIAKMDSLKLMTEGCKTFSEGEYLKYFNEIWALIYKGLINSNDQEYEMANLEALTAIINKLSLCEKEEFSKALQDVFSCVKGNLIPDAKLYKLTTKILIHVMKASTKSADFVLKNTMPVLVNLFNISLTTEHKVLLLETIVSFTHDYVGTHELKDIYDKSDDLCEIPKLCLQTLLAEDDKLRSVALRGLAEALYFLNDEMRMCLYRNLSKLLLIPQADTVRSEALKCLKNFTQHYSTEIKENIIEQVCIQNLQSLELYLQALLVIAPNQAFMDYVVTTLTKNYLDNTIETAEISLKCLKKLLLENEQNLTMITLILEQQIIKQSISWFFENSSLINVNQENIYEDISSIILTLIGHLNEDQQKALLKEEINRVINFFNASKNYNSLFIFNGLLLRSQKGIQLESMQVLLDIIEFIALRTENRRVLDVGAQLLANLINKLNEDFLNLYMINTRTRYENLLNDDCICKQNVFITMAWITKSLLTRGYHLGNEWTLLLIDSLETYDIAESFKIIMCNSDSLSTKNNCTIKLLYQQKLLCDIVESFKGKFKNEPRYLKAVGFLLQQVPKNVFFLHFSQVIRLIILCLDNCEEFSVLITLLSNISEIILKEESIAEEYVDVLLPRLCKLSAFKQNMQVRIAALRCLQGYTLNCPLYKLLPHKQTVIQDLTKILDDPKRLVRKEAMNVRLRWYLLDAPV